MCKRLINFSGHFWPTNETESRSESLFLLGAIAGSRLWLALGASRRSWTSTGVWRWSGPFETNESYKVVFRVSDQFAMMQISQGE